MADVLLVNADTWGGEPPCYIPYGVLWIAAYVRNQGYSVSILDRSVDKQDLREVLLKEKPKVIGISVLTGPVILDAIHISTVAKETLKEVKVVWGGLHPTIFPTYVLKEDYVDYIVKGEGEYAFLDLVQYVLDNKGSPETIGNLGFKKGKEFILNKERARVDITPLPDPAFDLLNDQKNNYIMKKFYSNRVVTLNTSRGCPWRCAFCYIQSTNQRKFRPLSADRIIQHMEFFEYEWGVKGFQFYDDEFDVDEERVFDMCDLLMKGKKNYRFSHFSRVDHINLHRLLVEKEAGLRFIEFGIESGSNRMLKFLQKDTNVEKIRYTFDVCKKAGVKAGAMFMIGLPTETKEEVMTTQNVIDSLGAHQHIGTVYKPYPATPLFEYCIKNNLFTMPETLEEQGKIYGLGEFTLNMSSIPMAVLKPIYNHFYWKNILNEMKNCIASGNFVLLYFYFRKRFIANFSALMKRQLMMIFSENSVIKKITSFFQKSKVLEGYSS